MLFADTVKINNDRIRYEKQEIMNSEHSRKKGDNEKQEIMNSEQFWL